MTGGKLFVLPMQYQYNTAELMYSKFFHVDPTFSDHRTSTLKKKMAFCRKLINM